MNLHSQALEGNRNRLIAYNWNKHLPNTSTEALFVDEFSPSRTFVASCWFKWFNCRVTILVKFRKRRRLAHDLRAFYSRYSTLRRYLRTFLRKLWHEGRRNWILRANLQLFTTPSMSAFKNSRQTRGASRLRDIHVGKHVCPRGWKFSQKSEWNEWRSFLLHT